jgi:hypothetical protein
LENEYDAYQDWLNGIGSDRGGKFAARKKRDELSEARKAYFQSRYPSEIAVEREITHVGGQELRWPQSINTNKTKMVIHHTASDREFPTQEEAMSGVRDIYKFHTEKRAW